jgi:hypothetical protein
MIFSFFKNLVIIGITLVCVVLTTSAQNLQAGDVVVVAYNFNPDQFALMTLVDLDEGEVLYMTDAGWDNSTQAFRAGEGIVTYVVPQGGLVAGSQIVYPTDDAGFTTQGVMGFFGLALAGDQLFVYQGSYANPHFIFGLNNNTVGWLNTGQTMDNQTSQRPSSLNALYAVSLNTSTKAKFNCSEVFSDRTQFLTSISNASAWILNPSILDLPMDGCGFDPLKLETQTVTWSGFENHKAFIFNQEAMNQCQVTIKNGHVQQTLSFQVMNAYELEVEEPISIEEGIIELCYYNEEQNIRCCSWPYRKGHDVDLKIWHSPEHVLEVRAQEQEQFELSVFDMNGVEVNKYSGENGQLSVTFEKKGLYLLTYYSAQHYQKVKLYIP